MSQIDDLPIAAPVEPYETVLTFWFDMLEPRQWWKADSDLDARIAAKFCKLHQSVATGEAWHWRAEARGRLAEIIVLDQFSRNIFRDKAEAFAWDAMALALSQESIASGADRRLKPVERAFLYMPFMHSESRHVHRMAEVLFGELGLADQIKFEKAHKDLIDRFGRYPHRNAVLGRRSTPAEEAYLASTDSPGF